MRALFQLLRAHRLVVIDHVIRVIRSVARNMFVSMKKVRMKFQLGIDLCNVFQDVMIDI